MNHFEYLRSLLSLILAHPEEDILDTHDERFLTGHGLIRIHRDNGKKRTFLTMQGWQAQAA